MPVRIGLWLRHVRGDIALVTRIAEVADELGYDSLWMPDRLIMPMNLDERLDHNHSTLGTRIDLSDPAFDYFAYLSYLAGRTTRLKLGTSVWQMGLRHPFVAARAIQTLDLVSGGRALVGLGAGWLSSEYEATGVDFRRRGRRLDEMIDVCQRLWSEDVVEHSGEFFSFAPVTFQPKPAQKPWPRLLAGGESDVSMRRAARLDGWIGRSHTPESVKPFVDRLAELRETVDHVDRPFEIMVRTPNDEADDLAAWEESGVTRLYLCPWDRDQDPVVGLRRFAAKHGLSRDA